MIAVIRDDQRLGHYEVQVISRLHDLDVSAYGPLERVQRVAHLDDLGGTTRAEPEDAHGRHATEYVVARF